ncbi:MAG: hypothetical protein HGA80_01015 [Candidatus Omnitrophica bacterium]|nr:hypothetical protein [Candidatus Omnitrophota bacterium]
MRKLLLVIFLMAGLLAALVGWALNSTWLTVYLARRQLPGLLPEAVVTSLSARQQRFRWPGDLAWDDVRLGIKYKGRECHVMVSRLTVTGLQALLGDQAALVVKASDAGIDFPPGKADGLDTELSVLFQSRHFVSAEGPVTVSRMSWDKLLVRQVAFKLRKDIGGTALSDIRAEAYNGILLGDLKVAPSGTEYSADFTAEGVDTVRLAEWNEQVADKLRGLAGGRVRFAGKADTLSSLEGEFAMSAGTEVSSSLLAVLLEVLPQLPDRKRLEALIRKGGQFPVELLTMTIRSDDPRHCGGELRLRSRKANLAINLTPDINTDGTWPSLFNIGKDWLNRGR